MPPRKKKSSKPLSVIRTEEMVETQKDLNFMDISATKGKDEGNGSSYLECQFLLINPKEADSNTKSLVQEILSLYMKELPAMNYAANTGKQSSFLERSVSNGKYCSLLLRSKPVDGSGKIIASVTYQIIPADAQYAEIPLAAVSSTYQHKGVGRLLYSELKRRLQDVGISTILCWGDKESEGFWHRQGFVSIAEVDTKGRARKLPIKADVRKSLCFPGGSTLMVSHLHKNLDDAGLYPIKLLLKSSERSSSSEEFYSFDCDGGSCDLPPTAPKLPSVQDVLQPQTNGITEDKYILNSVSSAPHEKTDMNVVSHSVSNNAITKQISSTYERNTKRRVWETSSSSSLKSKRVKATQFSDYHADSGLVTDMERKDDPPNNLFQLVAHMPAVSSKPLDSEMAGCVQQNLEESCTLIRDESHSGGKLYNVMLMDIADGSKKTTLTKIIWDLGGAVTTDGSLCTHLLTGKARRTLNFCTALCSGAWIVTPNWLKESYREGKFVDEVPFILQDEDYRMKFRVDLKEAVMRARLHPAALLRGYLICVTTNIQPPVQTLSAIVKSASGDLTVGLPKVCDKARTIFVACEEDMEEALSAVKTGIRTFSSDWFMNCIMKQELDLDAPQFAESL